MVFGCYRARRKVILAYSVHGVKMLEPYKRHATIEEDNNIMSACLTRNNHTRLITNRKGYSLVEVLVALAIIAILAAIAVPMIAGNIPRYHLKSAARTLVTDFQKAKMEAVKRNCDVELRFFPGAYAASGNVGSYQVVETAGGTVLLTRTMPKYVSLYGTNFTGNITGYNNQGLPTTAAGSVYLQNNNSTFYELSLSIAGYVSLNLSTTDPS